VLTLRQSRYANEEKPRGTVNPEILQSGPTRGVKQRVVFAAVLTLQDGRIRMATVATGGETFVLMVRLMLMYGQPMNWNIMTFLRNIAVDVDGTSLCEPDPCNKLGNTGEVCAEDATCICGTEPCLAGERCLAGSCVQCTSTANGATDSGDDRCRWYARGQNWRECGDYDDEDFTANEMCCECGGGAIAA